MLFFGTIRILIYSYSREETKLKINFAEVEGFQLDFLFKLLQSYSQLHIPVENVSATTGLYKWSTNLTAFILSMATSIMLTALRTSISVVKQVVGCQNIFYFRKCNKSKSERFKLRVRSLSHHFYNQLLTHKPKAV